MFGFDFGYFYFPAKKEHIISMYRKKKNIKQQKKGKKNMRTNERGITLIALIIMVILLVILAAVTIRGITGQDGILRKYNSYSGKIFY